MPLSRARTLLVQRLQRRKTRERERLFLAEGVRCVDEVLRAGARIRFAACSPRLSRSTEGVRLRESLAALECLELTDDELATAAATENPQGVFAVVEQPADELGALANSRRLLVLDALQDPGNVGTLIRSAAVFGLDGVITLDGTVDPWNPKAVRAAVGTGTRLAVVNSAADALAEALPRHRLLVAHISGKPVDGTACETPWALVVGNEGTGVRPTIRARAAQQLSIPMASPLDSLNAGIAGSILMYALGARDALDAPAEGEDT